MTLILRGRRWGFSLEELRQWLLIYEEQGERPQLETWIELADRKIEELNRQKAELEEAILDLQKVRDDTAANTDVNRGSPDGAYQGRRYIREHDQSALASRKPQGSGRPQAAMP